MGHQTRKEQGGVLELEDISLPSLPNFLSSSKLASENATIREFVLHGDLRQQGGVLKFYSTSETSTLSSWPVAKNLFYLFIYTYGSLNEAIAGKGKWK